MTGPTTIRVAMTTITPFGMIASSIFARLVLKFHASRIWESWSATQRSKAAKLSQARS